MTEKEKILRQIIDDFENGRIDGQVAIDKIYKLTGERVDIGYLSEYWASEDLNDFIKKLLVEPISDWNDINDERAIAMINEILTNYSDVSIVLRNSEALEKKYDRPEGTVTNKIRKHVEDVNKILHELKNDPRFLL